MKSINILLMSLILSSCASLNSQPKLQSKVISEGSLTAVETSPDNDVVYLHTGKNAEIICSSRGQDFAVVQSGGDSLSAKEGTTSLGVGANTSSGVAELGGINPGVLLSREVMFRTCEFMGNLKSINGLTPDVAKELFQTSLNAVLKISSDYSSSPGTGQATDSVSSTAPSEN
ncbi:hypothetical protein [Marinicella rhabdoformis]|uniref:hypothetical protein n=1 Tax=Marinicella rhabdoformis TaxID=2580566 RepID=UPI0012AEC6F5|nr:hypothetical protein [Marinicella rhabdoformis]